MVPLTGLSSGTCTSPVLPPGTVAFTTAHVVPAGAAPAPAAAPAAAALRQGEFDRKSGKLKNLRDAALWVKEVAAEHALLATASRKTMRLDRLAEYHAVAGATAAACWTNRLRRRV